MLTVASAPESVFGHPRFDWYAATINASVDGLRSVLCAELNAVAEPSEGPKNGYHHREVIKGADGRTLVTLLHGGNGDLPHAFASSDDTDAFVEIVRRHYAGRHRVSRMDASIDFDSGPGTWDALFEICGSIADGDKVPGDPRRRVGRVGTRQLGNWRHAPFSRTFYLGAVKSAVMVRLYEKGMKTRQDAARHGVIRDDISDDWVRLEVQVRPDGDSKRLASSASPSEAFGYSDWSRELLRRLDGSTVQRVHVKERRDSDHERAMQWMVQQYGAHLLEDVARLGGWDRLGESLRRRMEAGDGGPDVTPF